MLHDAFICHASEDKVAFVRPLAERLKQHRVEVWYDEFTLRVGDSLRRSIDRGLAQSRFGIVILSPAFLEKQWPQWELDGLITRQNASDQGVILQVWHGVHAADVRAYSPSLADKIAVSSDVGLDEVVRRLLEVIHPQGSTLVIARDHLLDWGCDPPVVTDDWWLDIVSSADSNPVEDTFQSASGWGRWGFPLPPRSTNPKERGWRLAWAAMQMMWQERANAMSITQITQPEIVHNFIATIPGLKKICHDYLLYLISYAPQLVIRGFGGEFEVEIEALYQRSVEAREKRLAAGDQSGRALTLDGRSPRCDEEVALRDPEFGGYEASMLACTFVDGSDPVGGPEIRFYDYIDYVTWMLSDQSQWLPPKIRDVLIRGMAGWGVWRSYGSGGRAQELGFQGADFTGTFLESLERAKTRKSFRPSVMARRDLEHRLGFSVQLLGLPESGGELAKRLVESEFLDVYFSETAKRRRKAPAKKDRGSS